MSIQSFASTAKDKRLVYSENEHLTEFTKTYNHHEKRIEGADETSLIQVIAHLNPVMIIDESHNFEGNLRVDTLTNINPSFVLNLTATPREKSNIISFVSPARLKNENMVKLPVMVSNYPKHADVINSAIALRKNLEDKAKEEENLAQVRKSVDSPPGMLTEDHHHTVHEESQVCYSSHLRPKSLHL